MTVLIGGPFDGAPSLCGEPVAPSIWPAWICGSIFYRTYAVAGRPRYDRLGEGCYVFAGLNAEAPDLEDASCA
jgi:hypothetical protein